MIHSRLGATAQSGGGVRFLLWAPAAEAVELHLHGRPHGMQRVGEGYFGLDVGEAGAGARYGFSLDRGPVLPDPASRYQPDGPHALSEVVEERFAWTDGGWRGVPRSRLVIYELHVGTFTPEGTFEAILPHLDYLAELGITAIELMPIAQFPGGRNWGYDGVGLFAAQNTYGGPAGLRKLVDAAHARGLAVLLDVVYNHLGPEGNYLSRFGPYFTERYKTPWGQAINYDGERSDHVRRFFIENALYWVTDCHIDGLRLDAVHAIVDPSPLPFVQELTAAVQKRGDEFGRIVHVIAESASNDARLLRPRELGGYGMDGQWNDDFHHALRTVITGERGGYYASYGRVGHLARAFRDGYVYTGQHSEFHRRRHGSSTAGLPGDRFVVFSQNHDHVGNRMLGERPTVLVSRDRLKLAAATTLLSPFVPLLFMGEEYAETAPFLYFISHTDPKLVEAVRKGRHEEFAAFAWQGEAPDPQSEDTFTRSKLDLSLRERSDHREILALYRELLALRREVPALAALDREAQRIEYNDDARTLCILRETSDLSRPGAIAALLFNFSESPADIFAGPAARYFPLCWSLRLDTRERRFGGDGSVLPTGMKPSETPALTLPPLSFALYTSEPD
jgi:maltooligosyltrehalose trehalohydrolase